MIYLDYAATTPLDERVLDAMLPYLRDSFGNAASPHARGRAAAAAVETARTQIAALVGADGSNVVFTSGSTEALNTALKGLAARRALGRDVLVVSAIEHKAVLDTADYLARTAGVEVVTVVPPANADGRVTVEAVADTMERVGDRAFAVAVMAVNNETGVVHDIAGIARVAADRGIAYVCDATQAVGWRLIDHAQLAGATFLTISAHKIHGPQGVGALVLPPKTVRPELDALIHGGGHERGVRSGTLNLAGIVGFGHATTLLDDSATSTCERLRDELAERLTKRAGAVPTIDAPVIAPHIASMWLPGVDADSLIVNTPWVAFASGSACTSAVPMPSHVLMAMGLPTERAEQTIRLSVGRETTYIDVTEAVEQLAVAADRIRSLTSAV